MQRHLSTIVRFTSCLALALSFAAQAAEEKKVDPTGTWKWSYTGQNGQTREGTMTLKLEGDKLTGTVPGRNNAVANISDASLKGDQIAFGVVREFGGNTITQKYSGTISGDTIKGKIESTRDGQPQTREWNARREGAKPAAAAPAAN